MSRLVLFLGSTREGRNGERIATHLVKLLKEKNHNVTVFDPLKMPFEMLRQPLHFMPDASAAPEWLRDANETLKAADGFVVVTPEYNCALPPALVNMLDHFPPASYRHRPVGMACYSLGQFGGMRAAAFARAHFSELGMVSIPCQFTVPTVTQNFSADGQPQNERIERNAEKLVRELTWYVDALKAARKDGVPN
ncbi:NADPH azoreductase-like [Pollicipes pollicipes]|uniref:NADPH azoreductase-like n=1 Tax=Pollicipes pollicipes TaxID=41117 RepID=UPI001884A98D|nr:NADPH azoreductase-like [Pollicipes pollicipes]XP_037081276.1 NADPH azoreductase-like [Pollicipes pollicipes]